MGVYEEQGAEQVFPLVRPGGQPAAACAVACQVIETVFQIGAYPGAAYAVKKGRGFAADCACDYILRYTPKVRICRFYRFRAAGVELDLRDEMVLLALHPVYMDKPLFLEPPRRTVYLQPFT